MRTTPMLFVLLVLLMSTAVACHDSAKLIAAPTTSTPDGSRVVSIAGTVANAVVQTAQPFAGTAFEVRAYNPALLLFNPGVAPIATAALDTAAPACTPAACPFSLPQVDLAGCNYGLLLAVVPQDDVTGTWVSTLTGVGTPADIIQAAHDLTNLAGVAVSVLSTEGLTRLADAAGQQAAAFLAQGSLVGRVLNDSAGQDGVVVATSSPRFAVTYFNADLSGTNSLPQTSSSGYFVLQPTDTIAQLYTAVAFSGLPAGSTLADAQAGTVAAMVTLYDFRLE